MPITDKQIEAALSAWVRTPKSTADIKTAMRAALEASDAAAWQPIETAPKDGSPILVQEENTMLGSWKFRVGDLVCDRSGSIPGEWVITRAPSKPRDATTMDLPRYALEPAVSGHFMEGSRLSLPVSAVETHWYGVDTAENASRPGTRASALDEAIAAAPPLFPFISPGDYSDGYRNAVAAYQNRIRGLK